MVKVTLGPMNTWSPTRTPKKKLDALNGSTVADDGVVLDQSVRANVAVLPDLCTSQHDYGQPDARACADWRLTGRQPAHG